MAKKATVAQPSTPPRIYKATREPGPSGWVVRGIEISEAEAVQERCAERDVVVCGSDFRANRVVAQRIENGVGPNRRQDPHESAGPHALPHFQQVTGRPAGHSFYEVKRKAKNP